MSRLRSVLLIASLAMSAAFHSARAELASVKVATQIGLPYLPLIIMQHDKIWERKAKELGVDVKAEYLTLGGGAPLNDALLSDSVQISSAGVAPLIALWDRTARNYKVKALSAVNASPMDLLTNKASIKTIRDFTDEDRIAVPSIKVSIQAIILQMGVEKAFGAGKWDALDNIQVAMAHPEAFAAITTRSGGISGYMASSPFQERALRKQGIFKVTDSFEIQGGPATLSLIYAKSDFVTNNPKLTKAFMAAQREAIALIKSDLQGCIDKYIAVTGDKTDRALIETLLKSPNYDFDMEPKGTLTVAKFMHHIGLIKTEPTSWKDYFFDTLPNGSGS